MNDKITSFQKYWRYTALAIQETLAYRISYITNTLSGFVIYLVIYFVWAAVYRSSATVGGFSWPEMQGYLLISLFTNTLVSGSSEYRISRQIRLGNIAIELVRPVDYQLSTFFITLGNSLSEGVLVGIVGMAFMFFMRTPAMPRDIITWLQFLPALVLSVTMKFILIYIFSLACFWTNNLMGISWLRRGITDFFSGALIPLSFFPAWLLTVSDLLPFRGIVFVPALVFIGRLSGLDLLKVLAIEALWIIGLWILAKFIWTRAMKKICIQGG